MPTLGQRTAFLKATRRQAAIPRRYGPHEVFGHPLDAIWEYSGLGEPEDYMDPTIYRGYSGPSKVNPEWAALESEALDLFRSLYHRA